MCYFYYYFFFFFSLFSFLLPQLLFLPSSLFLSPSRYLVRYNIVVLAVIIIYQPLLLILSLAVGGWDNLQDRQVNSSLSLFPFLSFLSFSFLLCLNQNSPFLPHSPFFSLSSLPPLPLLSLPFLSSSKTKKKK